MYYKQLNNGLIVPNYIIKKRKKPIAFSFFSGCGGMDLGFIQAGFEVIGANEFDAIATLTYMVNLCSYPVQIHYIDGVKGKECLNKACERYGFGKGLSKKEAKELGTIIAPPKSSGFAGSGWIKHHPEASPVRNFWFGDVRKLKGKDILDALDLKLGDIDCVMGGPPCQGFSQAGKQLITDPRNNLVYEYARMIVELQPKTFVMEEVPAIINFFDPDGVPVLDKFCLILSQGGYGRWEMLKKGLMMQSGCGVGVKGIKGNESIKSKKKTKKITKQVESEQN